jgi:hypothetical protein
MKRAGRSVCDEPQKSTKGAKNFFFQRLLRLFVARVVVCQDWGGDFKMTGRSKSREASGMRPLERRFQADETARTNNRSGARQKRR